ncbi:MAG TPA: SHOCT domain-containing protein [Acidimicrobiia bacterium]|nr:SHOCT domain-containing protein [Acidimicrobiia bacterium]
MRQNLWAGMTKRPTKPALSVAQSQEQSSEDDLRLARLKELGELRASGVLTEEEFAGEKARILG